MGGGAVVYGHPAGRRVLVLAHAPVRGAGQGGRREETSTAGLVARSVAAALVILVSGWLLTRSGEAIATETALGTSFVGFALLAASTSLPEVSTTIAAARLGRFDMAFSNVFGANLLDVGLLFFVDLVAPGPPVLDGLGTFSLFGALLGVAVTCVFLVGIVRRSSRRVGRLGADSVAVFVLYLAGLAALYTLR